MTTNKAFDLAAMEVELARLRAENKILHRSAKRPAARLNRINQAHADALLFLAARAGYIVPSRDYMNRTYGIGRRRWQWAVALLKMARLYQTTAPSDPSTISRLDAARLAALADPDLLRGRLSGHGRDAARARKRGPKVLNQRT